MEVINTILKSVIYRVKGGRGGAPTEDNKSEPRALELWFKCSDHCSVGKLCFKDFIRLSSH